MEEKLNINEIVKIEQLPKIFSQLELVGEQIDEELLKVKDLEATEDNKKEVKKVRANINNILNAFEDKRKEIKNKILEDYNIFNEKYEKEVKVKLQNASEELKIKIDNIEREQVQNKREEVQGFVLEHIKFNHLENIIDFDKVVDYAKLKINISTSLSSLKEDSKNFIERVANEVKLIEMEETPSNLLYEYQNNGYDLTKAKLTLIERQRQIEELAKQRETVQETIKEEEKVAEVVKEIITTPREIEMTNYDDEEEIFLVHFTVKGTKKQIKKIKDFLKSEGINYE